ncbi:hypothetical protein [Candidatus Nitrosocosmicus franklandus]|uniref:Uncharacterized protein n=1 Tax=Candidatus Nitrosocosmicus franklandianus TaxID=1798806 RepID=A0A484I7S5_9ARCH|nr:hypothetical protein [Candidatus Nitrosocosmicus franklandus]VFJ12332.1 conserved protein of unknown function [Candidatus Nitrosocosmicus franklandus]
MNESQLKDKFLSYLKTNPNNSFFGKTVEKPQHFLEIKNEALNRRFDFILAIIRTSGYKPKEIRKNSIEIDDDLKNIHTRGTLLKNISQTHKIKIQNMTIFPIEIKSNQDKLDERLGNQIIDAIMSFGRSVIILDSKHCQNMKKNGLKRILPSTIIGYQESDDKFVLINKFSRVISDSLLNINKIGLIRALEKSNSNVNISSLQRNLRSLQTINQKLIYNQIFLDQQSFHEDELRFVEELSTINQKINIKKEILKSIKHLTNYKITDFIE